MSPREGESRAPGGRSGRGWPRFRAAVLLAAVLLALLVASPLAGQGEAPFVLGPGVPDVNISSDVGSFDAAVRQAMVKLRVAQWEEEKERAAAADRELGEAASGFRLAYARALLAKLLSLPEGQRAAAAETAHQAARDRRRRADLSHLRDVKERFSNLPEGRERVAVLARRETRLVLNRLGESAALAAVSRFSPFTHVRSRQYQSTVPEERFLLRGGEINRTTVALARLFDRIHRHSPSLQTWTKKYQELDIPIEDVREHTGRLQEHDLREFHALALTGRLVDPVTGRDVVGIARLRAAGLAESALAQFLEIKGKRGELTRFFFGEPIKDLSLSLARELEGRAELQLPKYLEEGREPTPQEFFRAAARVIRHEQEAMIQAYNEGYLGGKFHKVGLDQLLRVNDLSGETSVAYVKARLDAFIREGDAAAGALEAATSTSPAGLESSDPQGYRLLKAMGYIEEDRGRETYVLPDQHAGFTSYAYRARNVDIPGRSWLQIVTLQNVAETVASIAIPELAGARVGAALAGLRFSRGSVLAGRVLTEMSTDVLVSGLSRQIDRATDPAHAAPLEWDRLVIESFVMGGLLHFSKGSTDFLFKSLVAASRTSQPMATALAHGKALDDATLLVRSLGKAKEEILPLAKGALGLVHEASLTTFFNTYLQDHMDEDAFLGALLQASLTRSLAKGVRAVPGYQPGTQPAEMDPRGLPLDVVERDAVPPGLLRLLRTRPELARRVIENSQRAVREGQDTVAHFEIMYGDPKALRGIDVLLEQLRGHLSWDDAQVVLRAYGDDFRPVMKDVARLRKRWTDQMIPEAMRRAAENIKRHYAVEIEQAQEMLGGKAELEARVREIEARRDSELDLATKPPEAPGSQTETSDIDRSSRSLWVRRELQAMYHVVADPLGGPTAPTSARSMDVNEYIEVRPTIDELSALKKKFPGFVRRVPPAEPGLGDGRLSHDEILGALGIASSLHYLAPPRRALALANRRQAVAGDAAAEATLDRQIDLALESLRLSEAELKTAKAEARAENARLPDSEIKVLAQDALYEKRMKKVRDLQFELERLEDPQGAKARELYSEIERRITVALRDGIETYSSLVGLDVILNGASPGEGTRHSKNGLGAAIDDQLMFIGKHVEGFNAGAEDHYKAGRAFGKYITRLFRFMELRGEMDPNRVRRRPEYDPTRRLLEFAETLLQYKSDPAGLVNALREGSRTHPKSADGGMAELFWLMEKALPHMEGVTGVLDRVVEKPPIAELRRTRQETADRQRLYVQHQWQWDRDTVHALGGAKAALALIARRQLEVEVQVQATEQELAAMRELGTRYHQRHWDDVVELERRLHANEVLYETIPWPLSTEAKAIEEEIVDMRTWLSVYGLIQPSIDELDDALYSSSQAYRRAADRRQHLRFEKSMLQKDVLPMRERAREEATVAALDLSGPWRCDGAGGGQWNVEARQTGPKLELSFREIGLEETEMTVSLERRWRRFFGTWAAVDGKERGLASIEPSLDGQEIRFTEWGTDYPESRFILHQLICRRGSIDEAPEDPTAGFLTQRRQPVEVAWQREELEAAGSGSVRFAFDGDDSRVRVAGGVSFKIVRGRHAMKPEKLRAGRYTLVVEANGSRHREPLEVAAGEETRVELRFPRLLIDDGGGEDRVFEIFEASALEQPLARVRPGRELLLVPGSYAIRIAGLGRSPTWLQDLHLVAGQRLSVSSGWGVLALAASPGITAVQVQPKGSAQHRLSLPMSPGERLSVPPGTYLVRWRDAKGKPGSREVTIAAGGSKTVSVP